jgi:hypothetical protein
MTAAFYVVFASLAYPIENESTQLLKRVKCLWLSIKRDIQLVWVYFFYRLAVSLKLYTFLGIKISFQNNVLRSNDSNVNDK